MANNSRNKFGIKEMLQGPGVVFLILWIIVSVVRIVSEGGFDNSGLWTKIGQNFIIFFLIWIVWSICLYFEHKYSLNMTLRRMRHKRNKKKLQDLENNPSKTWSGSAIFGVALIGLWLVGSIYLIVEDIESFKLNNQAYQFANAFDIVCGCFLVVSTIWLAGRLLHFFLGNDTGGKTVIIDGE